MDTILGSQHIQAIRIFRLNLKTLELESLSWNEKWIPGEVKQSVCSHAKAHGFTKPEKNCTCGIWACKSRKFLAKTFPPSQLLASPRDWQISWWRKPDIWVSAQVEMWGKVIEHQEGYRSEFARIIPDTIQIYPRVKQPRKKKLIKFLRQKYLGN